MRLRMKWYISLGVLLLSGLGISYQAHADSESLVLNGINSLTENETLVFEAMPAGTTPVHSEVHVLTLEEPELNDLDPDSEPDTGPDETDYFTVLFYAPIHHYFAFQTQKSLSPDEHSAKIPSARALYVLFGVFRI